VNSAALSEWVARRRRSLLFLLMLPVAAGLGAAFALPVALFPDIQFPRVRISLDAGDRPAQQMVLQVTAPVEQALRGIPRLTDVRSATSRGAAEISATFEWGTDMIAATLQANAAISQVMPQLPPGTASTIRRMDPTVFPIIAYSLTSPSVPLTALRDIALFQLRPLLTGISGVARIGVTGGQDEEYQILVDPARLVSYGVTFDDVAKAVTAANVLRAVGRIEDHYKLFLVVSNDILNGVDPLRKTVVPDGIVTVDDVATVERSTAPQWIRVTAGGRDAVLVNVYQQPGGNSVRIARDVQTRLQEAQSKLPRGISLANWYDQSELVTASAGSVRDAILIGAVLAALVLLLFLRSWKVTLIALLVVPASLSATILLLYTLHMSFNIMTLGGMAAAVGLIIDDAIVMIEHIIRRVRQTGATGARVLVAAAEFGKPLAGSSAATVVVFVPLAFLSGVTGGFFGPLSLTVAASLVFSFLITWFAVPLAAEWLFTAKEAQRPDVGALSRWVFARYRALAGRLLTRPMLVLIGILPLLGLGFIAYQAVGSGFMPAMDEGGFIIDYRTAPGTALSETDRLVRQVEDILGAMPEVKTWSRRTGAGLGGDLTEANQGDFFVRLKPGSRRPIDEIMAELRAKIMHDVPGLNIDMAQLMEDLIGDLTAVPQPIEIKLFTDDPKTLLGTARNVAAEIAKIPGVVDIRNGINPAGDALDVKFDYLKTALEGIDPTEATRLINGYLHGEIAAQIPTHVKQIGVRVWSLPDARATERDVSNLMVRAPDGHLFPLRRIARLVPVTGEPEIGRENLQRMVAVTARIEGRDLGSIAADVQTTLATPNLVPKTVRSELGGTYAQQQIAFRSLAAVFGAAVAAVFVLLLFLYESFAIALAILLMPLLAVCAVFIGLWLIAIELNITAMMGMTMIIGIVTEVAIFFFSEFVDLSATRPVARALVEAGQNRMRPIAMTTLAAILTLLPLALAIGPGSSMQQPLAVAIIFGLVAQLPLVLLVMPGIFLLLQSAGTGKQ
jgi:CzcA family heavy metal efflux pump